jgi:hypothetical protein
MDICFLCPWLGCYVLIHHVFLEWGRGLLFVLQLLYGTSILRPRYHLSSLFDVGSLCWLHPFLFYHLPSLRCATFVVYTYSFLLSNELNLSCNSVKSPNQKRKCLNKNLAEPRNHGSESLPQYEKHSKIEGTANC